MAKIFGKDIDEVHYLTMLRSLQRMEELGEILTWYVCDKGQLLSDFVEFSGVIPSPCDCIVTTTPIKSWSSHREFQWFCRIRNEKMKNYVYFTAICG